MNGVLAQVQDSGWLGQRMKDPSPMESECYSIDEELARMFETK